MMVQTSSYDRLIRNGWIVDGSGNPWFRADVGVKNARIVALGDLSGAQAASTIDAAGLVVCPGFIDIHNHSDISVLVRPQAENMVMQGVTTMVIGNCGSSAAPISPEASAISGDFDVQDGVMAALAEQGIRWRTLAEYLALVEKRGAAANVAALVGHGNVRTMVLGWDNRPPDAAEMASMRAHVAEAMEAGAFGLSFGLLYAPGFFAALDELIAVAEVAGRYGGFFGIHMRDERSPERYKASVQEALDIGKGAGLPVHISHIEAHYPNWGTQAEVLQMLQDARARGIDATCDVPPYLLSTSHLSVLVPDWAQDGGFARLLERLADPITRKKINDFILAEKPFGTRFFLDGNWDKGWLGESARNPQYTARSLAQIAAMRGVAPSFDVVFDLLLEEGQDLPGHAQLHSEEDMRILVAHPLSMIETDAGISTSTTGAANPRGFGSFPMTFRKYVRGEDRADEPLERGKKILTLQEAVRKMTSAPAQRLGLRDRGLVREGMWADLVIFDADTIADQTTCANPYQYPRGIHYVLVNGQVVVEKERHTGNLPGQVLRRP
ncbi:MAG: N-acyl-D-amino-acid deacylase family protein [Chloroflexota bacterium]